MAPGGHLDLSARTRQRALTPRPVTGARHVALFASGIQRSDAPTAEMAAEAITATVRQFGIHGCARRMAQEFGDHPEAAAERMRWICQLAAKVPDWPQMPAAADHASSRAGKAIEAVRDHNGAATGPVHGPGAAAQHKEREARHEPRRVTGADRRSGPPTAWTGKANSTSAGTAPPSCGRLCPRKARPSGRHRQREVAGRMGHIGIGETSGASLVTPVTASRCAGRLWLVLFCGREGGSVRAAFRRRLEIAGLTVDNVCMSKGDPRGGVLDLDRPGAGLGPAGMSLPSGQVTTPGRFCEAGSWVPG
jgi:hypothetical protein